MGPFERHKLMMSLRKLETEKKENKSEQYVTDYDILKKQYKFIHDASSEKNTLLQKYYNSICNKYVICDLSKYKETKVGVPRGIGLRWRTEEEIIEGKGHIICASKKCNSTNLKTYKFLFQYDEQGTQKQVSRQGDEQAGSRSCLCVIAQLSDYVYPYMHMQMLQHDYCIVLMIPMSFLKTSILQTTVKVRACMDCAYKLHYRKIKKYLKKKGKKKIKKEKRGKDGKRHSKTDSYSEESISSSSPRQKQPRFQKDKSYYVKRKLEKISLKNEEDKNEENVHFHDLLF
ncbi:conserved protein, unknown function [Plasmodium ovale curtisi]|nr:conserved protein, unknown function [Plasmodium ovale curtisi]